MKYTSSSQTFLYKYIYPVIMIVGGIVSFVVLKKSSNGLTDFAYGFGIAFLWNAIFIFQMPFRLKKIEADEKGIIVKSGEEEEKIAFGNVMAVAKFDLTNPWMITIKYFDESKNENRKLSYMRNAQYYRFLKDDEMTAFIKKEAKKQNLKFVEISAMKNFLILFLMGLPFFIGVIYFLTK